MTEEGVSDPPDYVREFLATVHGYDVNAPEICLEDDGDLGFDWLLSDADLSVSLSPTGRMAWSALISGWSAHGKAQWPEWPDELVQAFARLQAAALAEFQAARRKA